jgi:nucleoside-diphosphate-sugar epimerase
MESTGGGILKILVTGANGYIGSHLVPILVRRGHSVTCLLRDPEKAGNLAGMGVSLAKGDVTVRQSMREAMEGNDAVFHLAGWYAVGNLDQARMETINVDGARNVLELAVELGIGRIIHTSTVGVFGNTHGRIVDETYHVYKSVLNSQYERTKWAAHYEVAVPLQQKGVPLIILQPGFVTGKGDKSPHAEMFNYFLNRIPLMFGSKSGLTLAHVEDIAEGHAMALEKGRPGESYILCGPAITYRQVFELCEKITRIPATRLWAPGWAAAGLSDVMRVLERLGARMTLSAESLRSLADYTYWAKADKARTELGWTLRPLEEALREVLEEKTLTAD